ncbi:hypothetical protein [Clostridium sp.]|uniref:hypothetical protein n=1 Tax=Clostridium sp. TaxID=1506 RepID=UPI001B78E35C|nr:hypothetical protein [Clostridium sp.]MBP3915712.1 hypothetical protein [Clostridium sp.]
MLKNTKEDQFISKISEKGVFMQDFFEWEDSKILSSYIEGNIAHEDSFSSEEKGITLALSYAEGLIEEETFASMYNALKELNYFTSSAQFLFKEDKKRRYIVIVPKKPFEKLNIVSDNERCFYAICGYIYGSTYEVCQDNFAYDNLIS